jgi:hypothetical protein
MSWLLCAAGSSAAAGVLRRPGACSCRRFQLAAAASSQAISLQFAVRRSRTACALPALSGARRRVARSTAAEAKRVSAQSAIGLGKPQGSRIVAGDQAPFRRERELSDVVRRRNALSRHLAARDLTEQCPPRCCPLQLRGGLGDDHVSQCGPPRRRIVRRLGRRASPSRCLLLGRPRCCARGPRLRTRARRRRRLRLARAGLTACRLRL